MAKWGESSSSNVYLLMQQGTCQRNYVLNSTKQRGGGAFKSNQPGVNVLKNFK